MSARSGVSGVTVFRFLFFLSQTFMLEFLNIYVKTTAATSKRQFITNISLRGDFLSFIFLRIISSVVICFQDWAMKELAVCLDTYFFRPIDFFYIEEFCVLSMSNISDIFCFCDKMQFWKKCEYSVT